MAAKKIKNVRPDSKGRITLGKLARDVTSFNLTIMKDGRFILEPLVEIPAKEKWLFANGEALESVKRGLADSKAGRVKSLGSFAKFAQKDEED